MRSKITKINLAILLSGSMLLQACSTTSETGQTVEKTAVDRAIGKCVGSVAISTIGGALIGAAFGGNSGARQGALAGAVVGVGHCVVLLDLAADEDRRQIRAAELAALEIDGTKTSSIVTQSGKSAQVITKVTPAPAPAPKKVKKKEQVKKPKPEPVKTAEAILDENAPSQVDRVPAEANGETVQIAEVETQETQIAASSADSESVAPVAYFEEKPDTTVCRFTELFINIDGKTAETDKQKWCRGGDGSWQPVTS